MKDKLNPVGCIGLFGGDSTPTKRGAHSTHISIQPPTKTTAPRSHVIRPSKKREARQRARRTTFAANTGALSRKPRRTQLFSCREARRARSAKTKPFTSRAPQATERPASPAAASRNYNIVLRMKAALFAVGCMPLLGFGWGYLFLLLFLLLSHRRQQIKTHCPYYERQ